MRLLIAFESALSIKLLSLCAAADEIRLIYDVRPTSVARIHQKCESVYPQYASFASKRALALEGRSLGLAHSSNKRLQRRNAIAS